MSKLSKLSNVKNWYKKTMKNPQQISKKHYRIVSIFGRIGFFTKAFIYGFIGGLILQSTFSSLENNDSPQGVFILLGSAPNGASHVNLILMLAGVCIYATWRFWEGTSGQGYDPNFSRRKNFFKYRLSPIASGGVYTAYAIYIITLFVGTKANPGQSTRQQDSSCFPICWRNSIGGKIGLILLATAFTIATITQLIPACTGNFRNEINFNKFKTKFGKIVKYPFLIAGHLGFFARAVLFFLVCFLFWKIVFGEQIFLNPQQATVSQAINAIRNLIIGKIVMGVLGAGLLLYGIFAALCSYYKIFPTPPPSANQTLP